MSVYLDSGVLIALLYSATESVEMAEASDQFFAEIRTGRISALITFYCLPELYGYVERNYAVTQIDEIFRTSLGELLSFPIALKPFIDRTEFERLRRQISISDSYDIYHVAAALHHHCSAIITFDHHFQQVRDLIPVYTPDEYLATLAQASQDE